MGGRRFDASAAMFLQQASTTRDDPTANRVMTIEHLSDGSGVRVLSLVGRDRS